MYSFVFSAKFERKSIKLFAKDKNLSWAIDTTLEYMESDPFQKTLKTHKVVNKNWNICYSSRVNWDIRIIWDFSEKWPRILYILDIWWHSGKNKVYK